MSESYSSYAHAFGQLLAEIERLRASATEVFLESIAEPEPPDISDLPDEIQELARVLRSARAAMLKDPVGARAIISFLVAEGQAYAETEPGKAWRDALAANRHLDDLRELWEAISLDLFEHVFEEDPVPTAWVDMLGDILANRPDIELLLKSLRPDRFR